MLINARPVSLHIAPEEEFAAERLTESELRPGSPNNDINAIRSTRRLPGGYKQNPYFTDPDAWFWKMDIPDAFIHFERLGPAAVGRAPTSLTQRPRADPAGGAFVQRRLSQLTGKWDNVGI